MKNVAISDFITMRRWISASELPEGERRLAAIMFTDMVGYTALGQRNESLSLALVEEQRTLIRPILRRHNGREIKTIGDAFLVEFSNALDAVNCAYDIQRAAREFNVTIPEDRRIHLRVGLHLGDVIESQGDISGDAVNVASRIEPLAEDGGVCLTRQVCESVRNKFELPLASIGVRQLKNVSEPMEVYKMEMPWRQPIHAREQVQLPRDRLAVLPFANMSPDPNDEYFADGITDEIITTVSGISGLSVISRTSVMVYKGATKKLGDIGRELGVGSILEGSFKKAGNRIRVTTQLIDVAGDRHLWAQNYDRNLDDVFAVQSDIAKQVAEALQVRLLSTDKKRIEKPPTSNIDAYTLFLKGEHYFMSGFSNDHLRKAIIHFEEAIANDPNFGLAHAELAYCYNQGGFFGVIPSSEAGPKAKSQAKRALELDDNLAAAHQVMGRVMRNYDWDFKGAEREFKRAIELNPSFAEAYGGMAVLMSLDRRFTEAVREVQRALELDPVSGLGSSYAGTVCLYAGMYDDAIRHFSTCLEIHPGDEYARNNLGLAYVHKGRFEEGIREMMAVSSNPSSKSDLAFAYAKAGRVEDLRRLLEQLLKEVEHNHELAIALAGAYANLGERDLAMEWLEKAYEEHVAYLVSANSDFVFDCIRDDPRFQNLMRKVGWTNTT